MFNGFKGKSSGGRRGGSGDWKGGSGDRKGGSSSWKGGSGGYKGGKKSFGDVNEMHEATCSKCNKSCEVPFKPNGRKPIFCSACFKHEGGGSDNVRESRDSFGGGFEDRRPARPSFDRPSAGGMSGNDVAEQLKAINKNLEAIVRALTAGRE